MIVKRGPFKSLAPHRSASSEAWSGISVSLLVLTGLTYEEKGKINYKNGEKLVMWLYE